MSCSEAAGSIETNAMFLTDRAQQVGPGEVAGSRSSTFSETIN